MITAYDRWIAKVERGSRGCWLWTASVGSKGYGKFNADGRCHGAHRWGYEYLVGPIPAGLDLDHLCRVKVCVNPEHLDPVTRRENLLRAPGSAVALGLAKTHCSSGHEYDEANTYRYPNGSRDCVTCRRARARAGRKRRAEVTAAAAA